LVVFVRLIRIFNAGMHMLKLTKREQIINYVLLEKHKLMNG